MEDLLRQSLGETIEVEIVGAGGLWQVEADPVQLEAAILNLALNARDAMPDGGKLTIETSNAFLDENYARQHADVSAGQYVQIAVSDTGSGHDAEERRDRRSSRSSRRSRRGKGRVSALARFMASSSNRAAM